MKIFTFCFVNAITNVPIARTSEVTLTVIDARSTDPYSAKPRVVTMAPMKATTGKSAPSKKTGASATISVFFTLNALANLL